METMSNDPKMYVSIQDMPLGELTYRAAAGCINRLRAERYALMEELREARDALKKIADSAGSAPFWDLRSIALAALPPPEQEGK